MAKKFEITRGNAILNFSEEFCQSRCELVESESFSKVLEKFIRNQRRLETQLYIYLHERNADDFFLLGDLRSIFKLLLVLDAEQVCALRPEYAVYFEDRDMFVKLIEDIYLYWRKLQDMQLFSMTQRNQVTRVYSSLMLRKSLKNLY